MSTTVRSTPPVLPQPRRLLPRPRRHGPVPLQPVRPLPGVLVVVAHSSSARTTVLTALGDVDMSTSPLLRERLEEHIGELGSDLVVDLTGVRFLSAAGLTVLAGARDAASRAEIRFSVVVGTRAVFTPLRVSGLLAVLDVYPDLALVPVRPAARARRAPTR